MEKKRREKEQEKGWKGKNKTIFFTTRRKYGRKLEKL
jgi:hypothetical protein